MKMLLSTECKPDALSAKVVTRLRPPPHSSSVHPAPMAGKQASGYTSRTSFKPDTGNNLAIKSGMVFFFGGGVVIKIIENDQTVIPSFWVSHMRTYVPEKHFY